MAVTHSLWSVGSSLYGMKWNKLLFRHNLPEEDPGLSSEQKCLDLATKTSWFQEKKKEAGFKKKKKNVWCEKKYLRGENALRNWDSCFSDLISFLPPYPIKNQNKIRKQITFMYLNEVLPQGVVHGKLSSSAAYTNTMEKMSQIDIRVQHVPHR